MQSIIYYYLVVVFSIFFMRKIILGGMGYFWSVCCFFLTKPNVQIKTKIFYFFLINVFDPLYVNAIIPLFVLGGVSQTTQCVDVPCPWFW